LAPLSTVNCPPFENQRRRSPLTVKVLDTVLTAVIAHVCDPVAWTS
jgi:hypothetical protein